MKKKKTLKKVSKHKLKPKCSPTGRCPSDKSKESKVRKIKMISKKSGHAEEKKGFFTRLFGG